MHPNSGLLETLSAFRKKPERRITRFAAGIAAGSLLMWAVVGCRARPAAGQPCAIAGQLSCTGKDAALVCDSGKWGRVPCKGPRACAAIVSAPGTAPTDQCDDTVAEEADECPRNPPLDYACSPDHKRALVCKDGRFDLWRNCRGPASCEVIGGRNVHCDTSAGQVGDPCEKTGTYACSVDKLTMLVCAASSLQAASSCRGPAGCTISDASHKVDCDDTVASVGDPCDEPRRITCALDHKAELVCGGGGGDGAPDIASRYEKKRDCSRSDCRVVESELFCD